MQISNHRRRLLIIVACILIVLAAWEIWDNLPDEITPQAFTDLIRSWGMWGVIGSIALMIAHSFIPFPAEFVAIANGMCFGPVWGTVITWVGAMLGAVLAFSLSRRFGRPFVDRMVERKDWRRLDQWLDRHGEGAVFFTRFIPVIAFNLINYAAGLTRISLARFILATGFGILPMTILMVVIGAKMHELSLGIWLLIGATGIALWLIAVRFKRPERD
jgi:uncharacterized membrane protein YdjX (TVP38/TMEM64 family)